jgi:hypothetical protein
MKKNVLLKTSACGGHGILNVVLSKSFYVPVTQLAICKIQ